MTRFCGLIVSLIGCKRVVLLLTLVALNVTYLRCLAQFDSIAPSRQVLNISSDDRRIFFHETSGRNDVKIRQSCAVESAARNNPERTVELYLQTDRVNESSELVQVLRTYPNIRLIALNTSEYFANTPLFAWYEEGKWKTSNFSREHFSDYIRMLTLYKGGGLYMDLDFITIKTLNSDIFWNFVPIQELSYLTGSIMHLQHGHRLITLFLKKLAKDYRPNNWGHHGPDMINFIVRKYCNPCDDLRMLSPMHFYPIHYIMWKDYFMNNATDLLWRRVNKSYAVHVWNKLSEQYPVVKGSRQIYARLGNLNISPSLKNSNDILNIAAEAHCPKTYSAAGLLF